MEAKDIYKVAQILMAAESKRRDKNIVELLHNERFQRTFTDEFYPKRAGPGFQPLDAEQKKMWEAKALRDE